MFTRGHTFDLLIVPRSTPIATDTELNDPPVSKARRNVKTG